MLAAKNKPGEPVLRRHLGAGEVVRLELKDQVFLFVFEPGTKNSTLLEFSTFGALDFKRAIQDTAHSFSSVETVSQLVFKALGPPEALESLKTALSALGGELGGECAVGAEGGQAYFYSDTGRLRVRLEPPARTIRVLIVDDSRSIRRLLREVLGGDPQMEVVADTGSPHEVDRLVAELKPDVLTLDIHMPKLDGITLLRQITEKYAIPAVMVSSVNHAEAFQVLRALELGAVDYVQKPVLSELSHLAPLIREKVRLASQIKLPPRGDLPLARLSRLDSGDLTFPPIVLGASTGGPEALRRILVRLPKNIPPVLVAQHIPEEFSAAFASRLNELCAFPVREAVDGEAWNPGVALLAPGGKQTRVVVEQGNLVVRVDSREPSDAYAPCIDSLFDTVASACGSFAIGALLTGMGADGAAGLGAMKKAGALTFAQDESTSIVFGMPRAAILMGSVCEVISLDVMAERLVDGCHIRGKAA